MQARPTSRAAGRSIGSVRVPGKACLHRFAHSGPDWCRAHAGV